MQWLAGAEEVMNHNSAHTLMLNVDVNIYSLACYTFIVTGVVCAAVRWLHMCKPCDEKADYFYPARRQMSFFFFAVIMQIPYVLRPMDYDTWYYARTFGILYYPLFISVVFDRYFYWKSLKMGWVSRVYFILVMSILLVMMLTALLVPYDVMEYEQVWINSLTGAVSLVLSFRYVRVSCKVVRSIDEYHEQNFSNVSDFPYAFAKRVVLMPLVWMVMEWMVFISASRDMKAVTDIISSVFTVLFLCYILHPHRPRKEEDSLLKDDETETIEAICKREENEKEREDDDKFAEVRREVLAIIARRYKEPNLKRTEVIAEVSYRKKKIAGEYITSIGFYRLVNTFRLYHIENYVKAHPEISKEGAAISCGFKDRFALNNARKRIQDIDMQLIKTGEDANAEV